MDATGLDAGINWVLASPDRLLLLARSEGASVPAAFMAPL